MVGTRRRRRRLGPVAAVLVVAALVGLFVAAIHSARPSPQSIEQAERAYLDLARPLVQASNQDASTVNEIRARPAQLGRVQLDRELAHLVSDTAATASSVRALATPSQLARAESFLVQTMDARASAATQLSAGMNQAVGSPVDLAVASLVQAGQDMAASDAYYSRFLGAIPRSLGGRRAMPASRWVQSQDVWSQARLTDFARAVGGSTSLAVTHDMVLVLVSLNPEPISTGGTTTIPPTSSVRVTLVVANNGTVAETQVPVVASVQGSQSPQEVSRVNIDIQPNEHVSVPLPPLAVSPGGTYTLTSSVGPVAGETHTQDNSLTSTFKVAS
jgi:hypothetical protein